MKELKDLFDAFYSRFVLRDFFGKMVPGLVILWGIAGSASHPENVIIYALSSIHGLGWVAVFGVAWLAGFAVQGVADGTTINRMWPRFIPKDCFGETKPLSDRQFYQFERQFEQSWSVGALELRRHERNMLITEACGNGWLALLVSLLLIVIPWLIQCRDFRAPPLSYPSLVGIVFLIFGLWRMHRLAVERHYRYMDIFVNPEYDS